MGDVMMRQVTLTIASSLNFLLTMYRWIIFGSVIVSWVNADPSNGIVRFLRGVTEPLFYQVRRRLPFVVISGIDLSPIVVLLLVEAVRMIVVVPLYEFGYRFTALAVGLAIG